MIRIRNRRRICYLALLLIPVVVGAQTVPTSKPPSPGLVRAAERFLTSWFVKSDVDTAMRHVSHAPILGSCARPPVLRGRGNALPKDFRSGIQSIFVRISETTLPHPHLAEMIEPTGVTPSDEKGAPRSMPFDLFSLSHDFKESRFLCKFDNDTTFRRAFSRPDVWYLSFKVTAAQSSDSSWILAWRREGNSWRIFSLSPLED